MTLKASFLGTRNSLWNQLAMADMPRVESESERGPDPARQRERRKE